MIYVKREARFAKCHYAKSLTHRGPVHIYRPQFAKVTFVQVSVILSTGGGGVRGSSGGGMHSWVGWGWGPDLSCIILVRINIMFQMPLTTCHVVEENKCHTVKNFNAQRFPAQT